MTLTGRFEFAAPPLRSAETLCLSADEFFEKGGYASGARRSLVEI